MDETVKKDRVSRLEWLWCLGFVVLAAVILTLLGNVLRPVRRDYGSTWDTYLAEPKNSIDVLFFGSSYAYCDVNPGVIYDESGLTGYVMAGGEQTMGITYYYLKEALKTQTPSVVVLEGSGLFFQPYEHYTQINVGYMPFGVNKLGATVEFSEPELRTGLLFDLYFYHDRWKTLSKEDLTKALPQRQTDHLKGYTAVERVYVSETGEPVVTRKIPDEALYRKNLETFYRIARICGEKGVDLIVTINPTYGQFSQEIYDRITADVEASGNARFVNWANAFAQIGLDPTAHLYDPGHLNREGAAIFSRYMGRYLREQGYTPRAQGPENENAWRETSKYWEGQ